MPSAGVLRSTSGAQLTGRRDAASLWVEVIFPGLHPESSLKKSWELRAALLASLFLEKQVSLPGYIRGFLLSLLNPPL